MSIPSTAGVHPDWCHPRTCKSYLAEDGSVSYEHREPAAVMRPFAHPDVEVMVYRTKLEDLSTFPSIDPVRVTLRLTDTSSVTPNGDRIAIDVDLSPADVRMLNASLAATADKLEDELPAAQ